MHGGPCEQLTTSVGSLKDVGGGGGGEGLEFRV